MHLNLICFASFAVVAVNCIFWRRADCSQISASQCTFCLKALLFLLRLFVSSPVAKGLWSVVTLSVHVWNGPVWRFWRSPVLADRRKHHINGGRDQIFKERSAASVLPRLVHSVPPSDFVSPLCDLDDRRHWGPLAYSVWPQYCPTLHQDGKWWKNCVTSHPFVVET